jgi:hypothetical protein
VYLARKLAEKIDGVDLTAHQEGDVLDLPPSDARLIIAEGWGIPERRAAERGERRGYSVSRASKAPSSDETGDTNEAALLAEASAKRLRGVAADTPPRGQRRARAETAATPRRR